MVPAIENLFPVTFAQTINTIWPQPRSGGAILALLDPPAGNGSHTPEDVDQLLHPLERQQACQYRLPKRRREFFSGRICAKLALADYLVQKDYAYHPELLQAICIETREDRRPFFAASSGVPLPAGKPDLSITHSHDFAAALVADCSCGIDLQQMRQSLFKIRERFCSAAEEKMLAAECTALAPVARLVMLWSAKEAMQKAFSANHAMPGMLDMTAAQISSPAPDVYAMRFAINTRNCTGDCHALTTLFADNGLAVSLLPQGEPHAGTA